MSTGQANVRTRSFRQLFDQLPDPIKQAAEKAFDLFAQDPYHPALNNHPLEDRHRGRHRLGSRAVSVTRRYRAIYVVDGPTNVWYWIGSHEDYNNFTG